MYEHPKCPKCKHNKRVIFSMRHKARSLSFGTKDLGKPIPRTVSIYQCNACSLKFTLEDTYGTSKRE